MMQIPVETLLERVAQGNRAAFAALYSDTAGKLMGVCLRILRNRQDAEEALQEVFTRIWLRAGRYDQNKGRAMTWMIAIARNHAIDRLRAAQSARLGRDEAATPDEFPDATPGAEAQAVARGELGRIDDCFGQLDPDHATAVRGAYLDGFSYAKLAARHAVPVNTMRTWLRRSLLKLKDCLDG